MAAGTSYPVALFDANGHEQEGNSLTFTDSAQQPQTGSNSQTSGAMSTTTLSSGTGAQISASKQVTAYCVVTADATNNVASATVALSPDNSTYSSVQVISLAAAVNNTGAIALPVTLVVPLGWYVKITVVHATIGTVTYA